MDATRDHAAAALVAAGCRQDQVDDAGPDVRVVGTVRAPVQVAWEVFRPFGREIMRWWPIYDWAELEPPGVDDVGAVRHFKANGRIYKERLVARDDRAFTETYALVSSDSAIPIESAVTTVRFERAGALETLVTWSSRTRAKNRLLLPLIKLAQRHAYQGAIDALDRYFNPATEILELRIEGARVPPAWGLLPPSAYVTARLGVEAPRRTCVRPLTTRPRWDETLRFNAGVLDRRIAVSVWDARIGPDALLGSVDVDIADVSSEWACRRVPLEGSRTGELEISLRARPELQVLRDTMSLSKTLGGWLGDLLPPLGQLGFEIGLIDTTVARVEQGITRRLTARGLALSPSNGGRRGNLPGAALLDAMLIAGRAQGTILGLAEQLLALAKQIARSIHEGEQETYGYARYDAPLGDLPRRVEGLPLQEIMTPSKLGGMVQMGAEYAHSQFKLVDRYLEKLVHRVALQKEADPFEAFLHGHIERPKHIVDHWKDDVELCRQLIQGVNPLVIRAVCSTAEIPPAMVGLSAQGCSLEQLISDKRLFILDYARLAPFGRHRSMVFYAPIALVYRELLQDGGSRLNLVGIQLTRNEGPGNVVYTAGASPPNRYLYAKIQLACADNQYHQFISHLGLAHLAMEPLVIAHHNVFRSRKNRCHPIGKLLAPHLRETIAINYLARQTLVADPEIAFTDRTFAPGTRQALALFLSAWKDHDFSRSSFPDELASRGFDEDCHDEVDGYYYRDDGFKIWRALERYVTEIVAAVYPGDRAVAADEVVQRWAFECSAEELADIPGFPRAITSRRGLVKTLTTIIFQASAFHSAVNFPQRQYLSYVPNRPDATFAEMPPGDADISMDFILLNALPDFFVSNFQVSFAHLLTLPSDAPLSRLSPVEEASPFLEIHQRFQLELAGIAADIRKRNCALVAHGKQPYPYLSPDHIASSVAI
jgi:arachidonate 5-lipoxygenase